MDSSPNQTAIDIYARDPSYHRKLLEKKLTNEDEHLDDLERGVGPSKFNIFVFELFGCTVYSYFNECAANTEQVLCGLLFCIMLTFRQSSAVYNSSVATQLYLRSLICFQKLLLYVTADMLGFFLGASLAYALKSQIRVSYNSDSQIRSFFGEFSGACMINLLVSMQCFYSTKLAKSPFKVALCFCIVVYGCQGFSPETSNLFNPTQAIGQILADAIYQGHWDQLKYLYLYILAPQVACLTVTLMSRLIHPLSYRDHVRRLTLNSVSLTKNI